MELDYQQVEQALQAVDAETQAAEAQGLLVGMASVGRKPDQAAWIAQVLADTTPRGESAKLCLAVLVALYQRTLQELDDDDLSFQPLMPDDQRPLAERAQALGLWASGYLVGMGLGGLKREASLPAEVNETLADMDAIAQVEMDPASGEDDEAAYAELVEYVKVAVLLVRAHLQPTPPPTRKERDQRLH